MEAGIFNYGNDMDVTNNPFEVTGLERLVELDNDNGFVAREALERIREEACAEAGGCQDRRRAARHVARGLLAGRGRRGGGRAPRERLLLAAARFNMGFAWVPLAAAAEGSRIEIASPDGPMTATVTALPFLDPKKEIPANARTVASGRHDGGVEALTGQLLIAGPSLFDPNFRRTVVLIGHHDEEGAVGVVLNRSLDVPVREAVPALGASRRAEDAPLFCRWSRRAGGRRRGGRLRGPGDRRGDRLGIDRIPAAGDRRRTSATSIRRARVFAGYAGWGRASSRPSSRRTRGSWSRRSPVMSSTPTPPALGRRAAPEGPFVRPDPADAGRPLDELSPNACRGRAARDASSHDDGRAPRSRRRSNAASARSGRSFGLPGTPPTPHPRVLTWEREHLFAPSWVCLGRAGVHRRRRGQIERGGWVFARRADDGLDRRPSQFGNLWELLAPWEPRAARGRGAPLYEIAANWKLIHENYQECYHCSEIHPELCRVTPPDSGYSLEMHGHVRRRSDGPARRRRDDVARRPFPRHAAARARRAAAARGRLLRGLPEPVDQPAPRLRAHAPGRAAGAGRLASSSASGCSRRRRVERAGLRPGYAVEFWDVTNREDWAACESLQRTAASRGYRPGPLSGAWEAGVYLFRR